jgi:hypothetical protein
MERRGCGLGCVIAGLGLILACCLLPYLLSSIYSIITALLQVPAAPNWLWGDWIGTIAGDSKALYMMLAEGPICCVGTIALLIVILGLVLMISGIGGGGQPEAQDLYESYEEVEIYDQKY